MTKYDKLFNKLSNLGYSYEEANEHALKASKNNPENRIENLSKSLLTYHTPTTYEKPIDSVLYGIELEVYSPEDTSKHDCARSIHEIAQDTGFIVKTETDGSLDHEYGIEIIFAPMSELAWRSQYSRMYQFLKSLQALGCSSHDNGKCGLHIHISRSLKTEKRKTQEKNLKSLVYKNEEFFKLLSRRNNYEYCRFPNMYNFRQNKHYQAVNVENDNTIEIRFFRGTLNYESFLASLETIFCLQKASEKTKPWIEFRILSRTYKMLARYLTKNSKYSELCPEVIKTEKGTIQRKRYTKEERAIRKAETEERKRLAQERRFASKQQKINKLCDYYRRIASHYTRFYYDSNVAYNIQCIPVFRTNSPTSERNLTSLITPVVFAPIPQRPDNTNDSILNNYRQHVKNNSQHYISFRASTSWGRTNLIGQLKPRSADMM
jgi:hypothetical protein